jgi:hypothetical protein
MREGVKGISRNFSLKENKRPSFRGITAMTSRS